MRRLIALTLIFGALLGGFLWLRSRIAAYSPPARSNNEDGSDVPLRAAKKAVESNPPSVAALPPKLSRIPAASQEGSLADFEGLSRGRWVIKKNELGFVTRLAEAQFFLEAASPTQAARELLGRYGKNVFGLGLDNAGPFGLVQEEEGAQIRISQMLNSLPVLGAELNLIYDTRGNLIFAISTLYNGDSVPSPSPTVSAESAALSARAALAVYLSGKGQALGGAEFPLSALVKSGTLAYRLAGNSVALVYRYEISRAQPNMGDFELMVGAAAGGVMVLRELSRK